MSYFISRKKRYRIYAALCVLICVRLIWSAYGQEGAAGSSLALSILASAAAAGLFWLYLPDRKKTRAARALQIAFNLVTIPAAPLCAVWLVQNFTLDPWRIYPAMLAVNLLFYALLYLFAAFLTGSFRVGYTIMNLLFFVIGIANYFVVAFRGAPIVPWDLFSLGTAALVAGNFSYEISWRFAFSAIGFLILIAACLKNSVKMSAAPGTPRRKGYIAVRAAFALLTAVLFVISTGELQKKEVKTKLGMDMTLFTPNVRYRNNGFLAAFLGNLHLINVQEPSGYSVKAVKQIQEEIGAAHEPQRQANTGEAAQSALAEGKLPNIVIVLDEAFSDLQVLGSFQTDVDYMPNFRKLMEEGFGGQLMVSVKGGNTANSEYELFSGDTMAFLPAGSVVYQQFIRDNIPVLPSYLAGLGYETTAIHPYLATGWDRDKIYPLIGFEQFLSQSDFVSPQMLRIFISDQSGFDKITDVFERQKDSGPQFIFEITMQNHSGYSKEYPGFTEEVHLTGLPYSNVQTKAAEKYLTLVKHSDEALGEMMEYFRSVKEPTIVVMFGDHQPSDYVTDVIARMTGYQPETSLEEAQKAYIVPMFIWNNFGMKVEMPKLTSLNYLAANLLEAAGLPLTQYHQFLLDLQKELPVICAGAFVDKDGTYRSFDGDRGAYADLLDRYNILQYNHMTDIKNRVSELFALPAGDAAGE